MLFQATIFCHCFLQDPHDPYQAIMTKLHQEHNILQSILQTTYTNVCLKHRFFNFLMHLGFANLSKPAMKSKYFGLFLGDGDVSLHVHHGCYWDFCTVLPAPLEMTGTEGLEQYKQGSISLFYSLMFTAVQTASLLM